MLGRERIEFDPRPLTLEGVVARIEPLDPKHSADLFEAGRDKAVWRYMPKAGFADLDDARAWIADAVSRAKGGNEIPFAIVHRPTGRAVGSTRYLEIRREHRGLEIGWTWINPEFQRTALNTECKLLLLSHAFEALGAIRVQLKTDHLNLQSQAAIERLGAQREGVLRRHMIRPDGSYRDSVYYSITDDEWPAIRAGLQAKLDR